jgi:hypothetical protein
MVPCGVVLVVVVVAVLLLFLMLLYKFYEMKVAQSIC